MRIRIKKDKFAVKFTNRIVLKIKTIARDAMELIKCGSHSAICGQFRCSEEVRITENKS